MHYTLTRHEHTCSKPPTAIAESRTRHLVTRTTRVLAAVGQHVGLATDGRVVPVIHPPHRR